MKARPVPIPTIARPRNPRAGSATRSATALPTTRIARPTALLRRAPHRSAACPPGICIAMCTTNWTVTNSPIVASPTPYAWLSRVATGPSAARFQPAAAPIAIPPAVARPPIPSSLATRASLRRDEFVAAGDELADELVRRLPTAGDRHPVALVE